MPFLDSNIIRPLYDVFEGGGPKAFMCMENNTELKHRPCGKIFMKLSEIIKHVEDEHGVIQLRIFAEIKPTRE